MFKVGENVYPAKANNRNICHSEARMDKCKIDGLNEMKTDQLTKYPGKDTLNVPEFKNSYKFSYPKYSYSLGLSHISTSIMSIKLTRTFSLFNHLRQQTHTHCVPIFMYTVSWIIECWIKMLNLVRCKMFYRFLVGIYLPVLVAKP